MDNFEITQLTHESFIDTTRLEQYPQDGRVETALNDPKFFHGFISPSLRQKILDVVNSHQALSPEQREAYFKGETTTDINTDED